MESDLSKNREREYQKKYRLEHRDQLREYQKIWKIKNREKFKESQKKSYQKKREYYIKKQRDYCKKLESTDELKHRKIEYQKKYLESAENIIKVKARAKTSKIKTNGKCEICKKNLATQKHHLDYDNPLKLQFLCGFCHNQLHRGGICGF